LQCARPRRRSLFRKNVSRQFIGNEIRLARGDKWYVGCIIMTIYCLTTGNTDEIKPMIETDRTVYETNGVSYINGNC
jgi:hypothetical protein